MKQLALLLATAAALLGCSGPAKTIHTLKADAFAQAVEQQQLRLVDVRTAAEFAEGHLAGAENIDVNRPDFMERIGHRSEGDLKGTRVAVYCRGGQRSLKAARLLAAQGAEVYNLDGGIMAWQRAGKETVR